MFHRPIPLLFLLLLTATSVGVFETRAADEANRHVLIIGPAEGPPTPIGPRVLGACLRNDSRLTVEFQLASDKADRINEAIRRADCVVLCLNDAPKWIHADAGRLEAFAGHAAKGGGFVALGSAVNAGDASDVPGFLKLLGGCRPPDGEPLKAGEVKFDVVSPNEPIARGVESFTARDKFYYRLRFAEAQQGFHSVLRTKISGRNETVAWAWERPDRGRSFGFSGGLGTELWKQEFARRLITQGVLWSVSLTPPADGAKVEVAESQFRHKEMDDGE